MRAWNKFFGVSVILVSVSFSSPLFAQKVSSTSVSSPAVSSPTVSSPSVSTNSISSPSMPTISAPSLSQGFYIPGDFYQKKTTPAEKAKEAEEKESAQKNEAITSLKNYIPSLTAQDISSLGDAGFLDSFSFLNTKDSSSVMLEEILKQLEQIKNAQNTIINTQISLPQTSENSSTQVIKSAERTDLIESQKLKRSLKFPARILRFTVNNYDILKTCKKIYISRPQNDGTFLVSADRLYSSDNKNRNETFHILFTCNKNETDCSNYRTTTSVNQDYLNAYSFLYQMSQKENLFAYRTGNFVTLKTNDSDWKLDLLIDLGEEE